MNIGIVITIVATCIAGALYWGFFPGVNAVIATPFLSPDEINACAVMVARRDYRRQYDWAKKTWIPDILDQADADQALLLDEGERPDLVATRDAYRRRFSLRTVYDGYVERGTQLCLEMKIRGQKIEMPILRVKDGYHITRGMGSGMIVKDGAQEPTFGCIEGYHYSGNPIDGCVK